VNCPTGDDIPIEERDEDEVHFVRGETDGAKIVRVRVSPRRAAAANPAFDVTPARYITGIITEQGILKPGEIRRRYGK
jgi:methylthioribose-1-phosphate isomerase